MSPVKVSQPVSVGREVRRNPVENDGNAVLVEIVDQVHEILRRAVARGRSEVAGGLVSPGAVKRVLHHGQEFDVSESQLADVFGEAGCDFAIRERAVVFLGNTHPGAEVDFIDCLRGTQRIVLAAPADPLLVLPLVGEVPNYRRRTGRFFVPEGDGVGFVDAVSVAIGFNVEFVQVTRLGVGDEALPDARGSAGMQAVSFGIPAVEAADDRNRTSVRSPDAEDHAGLAVGGVGMGAHLVVNAVVAALVKQVEILVGQKFRGGESRIRAHGFQNAWVLVYRSPGRVARGPRETSVMYINTELVYIDASPEAGPRLSVVRCMLD